MQNRQSYEMFFGPVLFAWRRRHASSRLILLLLALRAFLFLLADRHVTGTDRTTLSGRNDRRLTSASDWLTLLCVTDDVSLRAATKGAGVGEPFLVILEYLALKKTGSWDQMEKRVRRGFIAAAKEREKRDTASPVIVLLLLLLLLLFSMS